MALQQALQWVLDGEKNFSLYQFFAFECESSIVKIAWNAKSAPIAMDASSASTPSESTSKQLFEKECSCILPLIESDQTVERQGDGKIKSTQKRISA